MSTRINRQPAKGVKGGLQKLQGKIQEGLGNAQLNAPPNKTATPSRPRTRKRR